MSAPPQAWIVAGYTSKAGWVKAPFYAKSIIEAQAAAAHAADEHPGAIFVVFAPISFWGPATPLRHRDVKQPLGEPQQQQQGHQADQRGADPLERGGQGDFLDHPPDDGDRQERDHQKDQQLDHEPATRQERVGS